MTALDKPRPERWPQFSLKGFFVLVTMAALLLPWVVAKYRIEQKRELLFEMERTARPRFPGIKSVELRR